MDFILTLSHFLQCSTITLAFRSYSLVAFSLPLCFQVRLFMHFFRCAHLVKPYCDSILQLLALPGSLTQDTSQHFCHS